MKLKKLVLPYFALVLSSIVLAQNPLQGFFNSGFSLTDLYAFSPHFIDSILYLFFYTSLVFILMPMHLRGRNAQETKSGKILAVSISFALAGATSVWAYNVNFLLFEALAPLTGLFFLLGIGGLLFMAVKKLGGASKLAFSLAYILTYFFIFSGTHDIPLFLDNYPMLNMLLFIGFIIAIILLATSLFSRFFSGSEGGERGAYRPETSNVPDNPGNNRRRRSSWLSRLNPFSRRNNNGDNGEHEEGHNPGNNRRRRPSWLSRLNPFSRRRRTSSDSDEGEIVQRRPRRIRNWLGNLRTRDDLRRGRRNLNSTNRNLRNLNRRLSSNKKRNLRQLLKFSRRLNHCQENMDKFIYFIDRVASNIREGDEKSEKLLKELKYMIRETSSNITSTLNHLSYLFTDFLKIQRREPDINSNILKSISEGVKNFENKFLEFKNLFKEINELSEREKNTRIDEKTIEVSERILNFKTALRSFIENVELVKNQIAQESNERVRIDKLLAENINPMLKELEHRASEIRNIQINTVSDFPDLITVLRDSSDHLKKLNQGFNTLKDFDIFSENVTNKIEDVEKEFKTLLDEFNKIKDDIDKLTDSVLEQSEKS